jgi:hypothetical protein
VRLIVYFERKDNGSVARHLPEYVTTGRDGRFRVDGVASGLLYQVLEAGKPPRGSIAILATHLAVKTGHTRDLGDVKAKPFPE